MPDTDDAPPPAPTPARIALGICAHVLHGRAEVLRSRTGRQGRHATQDDIAVRDRKADNLDALAGRLLALSRHPDAPKWPSSDAALVGHLAAWLMDAGEHRAELLLEMTEAGRTLPPGARANTMGAVEAALGVPR